MTEPPGARLRVGLTGLTVAEYFRDVEGQDVLLFIDNIFRFTQAGSEVSALLGRMPSRRRLPAEPGHRDGRAAGAHHLDQEGLDHLGAGDLRARRRPHRPGAGHGVRPPRRDDRSLARRSSELGIYPAVDPLASTSQDPRPPHPRRRALQASPARCRPSCRATRTCRTSSPSSASTSCPRTTSSPSRARARSSASCRSRSTSPSSSPASRANTSRSPTRSAASARSSTASTTTSRSRRSSTGDDRRGARARQEAGGPWLRKRNVLGRLRLLLVTYEKKVLEVECDEVTLPGKKGYFGVLPGHVAMIASLKVGELMYRLGKIEHYLALSGGFCEVVDDVVTVMAEFGSCLPRSTSPPPSASRPRPRQCWAASATRRWRRRSPSWRPR